MMFAVGTAFVLFLIAVVVAYAILLWWLAKNKQRGVYIGLFVVIFLFNFIMSMRLQSGTAFMWHLLVAAWTYFISSIALWRAASKDSKLWFAGIFLISYLGILPAIYVWLVEKLKKSEWYE